MKKIIFGMLSLCTVAFGSNLANVTGENVGVFLKDKGPEGKTLIYRAEHFHKMATVPGFSMGAPSGLVPGYGVIFAGLSGTATGSDKDAALAMGMGFGNPDTVGGALSLGIGSVDPRDGGSFNRGSLNASVGHHFKKYGMGVSVGVSSIDLWHANSLDGDNADPSFYTAVTKLYPNEIAPVIITAGLGNNGYVDINKENNRKDKIDGFGSVAVYVMPQVSLILDYTMGVVSAGTSIVPFPDYPVTLNLGAGNLTKQGNNEKISAIGSIAAAYVF